MAAIAFLSAAQLLVVGLSVGSVRTPAQLLAVSVLAEAPIIVGAAAAVIVNSRRKARERAEQEAVTSLVARVELAEAILAQDQERMHELRATVTSIVMSHRLLTDNKRRLTPATKRRLERVREAELTRIERLLVPHPDGPVASVELADVLDPLVDAMRFRGQAVLWTGTRCRAQGRADDVAEIAHILLGNAEHHAQGHQVVVEVADCGDRVEVRVSDDGPGVAPALAPYVFERGIRSATSSGDGIGLHIAHRLARDLGGDLRLENVPADRGAVFVLQLPEPRGAAPCLAPAV